MVIQNKRILQILNLLNKNDKTITGKYLADSIGVSTRTIRNDIKEVEYFLKIMVPISLPNLVVVTNCRLMITINMTFSSTLMPLTHQESIGEQILFRQIIMIVFLLL